MIKKLAVILTFFLIFFSINSSFVYSQGVGELDKAFEGLECGRYNNKCCEKPSTFEVNIPQLPIPIFGYIIDKVLIPLEALLTAIAGPILNKVSDITIEKFFGVDIGSTQFSCVEGKPADNGNTCLCVDDRNIQFSRLCLAIKTEKERSDCSKCVDNGAGVWTALGCLKTSPSGFIQENVLGGGIGLAGLVSLFCIIYSAFILQTSRGNPERIKKAREYLTNCILGLLLIIFSVFILRLIGVDILRIPGFT